MSSGKPNNNQGLEDVYQSVRFEWPDSANDLGIELIQAFASK
jgi:hypothetical protein